MASSSSLRIDASFFKPRISEQDAINFISKHLDSIFELEIFMDSYPDVYRRELKEVYLRLKPIHDEFLEKVFTADLKRAEEILLANPDLPLLTLKGRARNSRGHIIEGTALQIAVEMLDVRYHDDEEGMVEMLIRHMKKLPRGELIIAKQFKEHFPDDYEERIEANWKIDSDQLHAAFDKICQWAGCSTVVPGVKFALKHQYPGLQFIVNFLTETLKFYDRNYIKKEAHRRKTDRTIQSLLSLIWIDLAGQLQAHLPDNFILAIQQGLFYITKNRHHLDRKQSLDILDLGKTHAYNHVGEKAPNHYVVLIRGSGPGQWPPLPDRYERSSPMTKCTVKYFERKKSVLNKILQEFDAKPKKTYSFRF